MKAFSINFLLRKSKGKKSTEEHFVFCRITMNKVRKEFSIGRKISPIRWNAPKGLSLGRTPEEKELNAHIATIQETFYKIERVLVGEGLSVTTELLLERYNKVEEVPEPKITFFVAMDEHNEEMRLLKEKGHIARESYSRYLTTKKYLERYIKEKYDKSDLEFEELNLKFLKGFDTWLRVNTLCENNTVMKYLKSVKKIINFSIQQEYLNHNPFIGHKIILEPVARNYLSKEELARIKNLVLNNERLNLVRYIFLFGCYTGLSYCDLKKLTIHDFKTDNEGKQWIIKERDKTKVQSNIKVLNMTLKILEELKKFPNNKKTLFKLISHVNMNAYLKEIAVLANINQNLTYHMSRHTFATTITLANGVSIESVSRQLGHSNIKQTQHYARMLNSRIGKEMEVLNNLDI